MRLSILSQLLLKSCARSCPPQTATAFQFFPSCCEEKEDGWGEGAPATRLSILSQLLPAASIKLKPLQQITFNSFPVAAEGVPAGAVVPRLVAFNSFPVAAHETGHQHLLSYLLFFQFFPSCCAASGASRPRATCRSFQFFPSCCLEITSYAMRAALEAFNSFPVAAEVLASWLLINLSTANFEVSENSPALPPDVCSGSRKPFPDSRRKEGIWTERNDV